MDWRAADTCRHGALRSEPHAATQVIGSIDWNKLQYCESLQSERKAEAVGVRQQCPLMTYNGT
jgi:hypothetical protein